MTPAFRTPTRPSWVALLPGVLAMVALLALFRETAAAMVTIWMRSETFAHAFIVPPIVLWLVWRRRSALFGLQPRAAPMWLLPMALACLLWLMGELAGVNAASQFALVCLVVLSVPAVFGTAVAREVSFPLAFLFFSVPVGEFLTAPMIDRTADFTVAAIKLSGIPVYREGNQFVIPSGNWSVVEACSGVRYLIASFMVGTLFAYLNFRSTTRRLVFIGFAILVPIVANWLRAYMIVMLGHLSGNKLAVGADHLVYGWVFFGIVIMFMFMIGSRFAEPDEVLAPANSSVADSSSRGAIGGGQVWAVAAGIVALLLATQALMWRLDARSTAPAPVLSVPDSLPGGWTASERAKEDWTPSWSRPNAVVAKTYRRGNSVVSVWIGYYRDQDTDRKLVSSTNVLVDETSTEWLPIARGRAEVGSSLGTTSFRTAELRSPADPKLTARQRLQVLQTYRIGGRFVARDAEAKLLTALERLLGRGDDGAVIFFASPVDDRGGGEEDLQRFVAEHLGTFAAVLDAPHKSAPAR